MYKKKKDQESKDFLKRLDAAHKVLDKYYFKTNMSPFYAAALILNPKRRTRYIETHWPKKWARPTLAKVKKLWEKYREQAPLSPLVITTLYDAAKKKKLEKELDIFDQIAQDLKKHARPASQDEYQDYTHHFDQIDLGDTIALQWWSQDQQRKRWPRLSLMAFNILLIPAISDEPKRVFSGARRTISWERISLGADTVEATECLKHWKRSGILNKILSS